MGALGKLPIVAETLGVITPEVVELRDGFGFPGMGILQFAFGTDPQSPDFKPHNYKRNFVAYTGTHDNDTTLGWWASTNAIESARKGVNDSTRMGLNDSTRRDDDIRLERDFALRYLSTDGREMNWVMMRAILASVANLAIMPLQDVLGLGSEARMNLPARASGNWRWRFVSNQITPAMRARLTDLVQLYERIPVGMQLCDYAREDLHAPPTFENY